MGLVLHQWGGEASLDFSVLGFGREVQVIRPGCRPEMERVNEIVVVGDGRLIIQKVRRLQIGPVTLSIRRVSRSRSGPSDIDFMNDNLLMYSRCLIQMEP